MDEKEVNAMIDCLLDNGFSKEAINLFRNKPTGEEKIDSAVSKPKIINQWLKENLTPEQYENAKKFSDECWDEKVETLSEAMNRGFYWIEMPEGFEYWRGVCQALEDKGF